MLNSQSMPEAATDRLPTAVKNLRQLMKVVVANPEVARCVAESVTVVTPVAIEERIVHAVILLNKYPALTAGTWTAGNDQLFRIRVASWNFNRISYLFSFVYFAQYAA